METIINFFVKYAFVFVWSVIIMFNILNSQSKKLYKYEQRIPSKNAIATKIESNKNIHNNNLTRIRITKIFLISSYCLFIIFSICTLVTYGIKYTKLNSIFNPLLYIIITTLLSEVIIKFIGKFKLLIRSPYIILYFVFYCIWAYNKTFFIDLLIVFASLVLYIIFAKSKYNYCVLYVLLGVNIIVFSNSFDKDKFKVIIDILFSIGTGLIVTGIGNILLVIEKGKKKINERESELDEIKFILEELMENIFLTYSSLDNSENFYYIHYEQFSKDLIKYIDDKDPDLQHDLKERIISDIEMLEEYTDNFLKKEKYFILNKIFNQNETNAIYSLYETSKNLLIHYKTNNNQALKVLFKRLIKVYDELSSTIPEIEDLINQFGKDKIYVEYEVGTFRQVWSNGDKVKLNEIYKPKSKRK